MASLGETAVGSIVKLNVKGELTDFIVVNQGKPSDMYDKSCDGTWVLMKDGYGNAQWFSASSYINDNSFADSYAYRYLNENFLGAFSRDIQKVVKEAKIPYRPGNGTSPTVNSGANGLRCKVFLLSALEVGFTQSNAGAGIVNDDAKLDYFQDSNGTPEKICYYKGNAVIWWTRTPSTEGNASYPNMVWCVNNDGSANKTVSDSIKCYRPALILPPSLIVEDDGSISVPTIGFPSGGLGVQFQDNRGRPVLPQTRGDLVEGLNGDSVAGNLADLQMEVFPITPDPSAAQLRKVTLSQTDLEAGVSPLATGELYFVYE